MLNVLLKIFVDFQDSFLNKFKVKKNSIYLDCKSFVSVLSVTFDQFNASLVND